MDMKFIFDIQRFAFSGGSGTSSNPYIINTAEQLKELANNVSNWSYAQAHYKLGANIDLANADFKAIGTEKNPFKGNFDGDGHTISNLKISAGTYEGLFGYTEGATIQNVTVSNITTQNYNGSEHYVGGIAGFARNSTFEKCIVESGIITGNNSANLGGIVGYVFVNDGSTASEKGMAHSLIQECQVKSAVQITPANSWVNSAGGIVGNAEVTNRQPCVGWSDFSVYLCNSNATFNFSSNSATTGGIIGKLTPKVLTNAQNLTVFYNIGVHDSFFGGNTSSTNNDFASIVGTVNFPESKYISSLGEKGSPLRLSGNYYYSASGNELNTASNVADHVSESKKPARLYKISVPEGVTFSDVKGATKGFDGNYYATQDSTVTFKLSATDSNCIIYGDLDLGSATYYEGTYTAKISKVDDPEDPDYNKYKDVEIGIGTAELRKVKGDGWSYDTSAKKLSITKDLTDFTSENSEWYVWHDDITSVEIASGVTKIPAYAFQNCGNISSFNNKGNITSIGTGAFDGTQYKKLTLPTSGITVSGATFSLGGDYYIKQGDEVTLTLTAGYLSGKNAVDVRFLEYGHYGSIKINSRTYNTSDTTTSIKFNMPKENLTEEIFNFAPVISGLTFNSAGRYYEIKDAQDMVDLATYIASGKDNFGYGTTGGEYLTFKMTADIDMSTVTDFHGIGTINHYPIAMGEGYAFRGTFDGDGHKITGLNINNISVGSSNPNYAGLFSWVSEFSGLHGRSQAVIKNLTVVNPQVTGGNAVGGIAGYVGTNVLIENCQVIGGTLSGNYKSSANRSFSTYSSSLGGIAGDCVSVSSKYDAAKIKGCTVINPAFEGGNKGALTGRGGYFISTEQSPNRYYLEDKSINFVGGGFAGGEGIGSTPLYKVTDVAGDSITVSNITCANDSKVEIDGTTYYKQGAVLTFTVNNTDSNFVPAIDGTELVKSGNTYTYTVGKSDVEISALFKIEGEGTEASPYLIKNANALKYFAEQVNAGNSYEGKFIKLDDNITLNDDTFPLIGIDNAHTFKGNFDGNDKTITATITKSGMDYVSLFGYNYGTIENLNVNATFQSERAPAYGICGTNYGTIKNVKLSGSIKASNNSEYGICGHNYGTIEGCVVVDITGSLNNAIASNNREDGNIKNCINATNSESVGYNNATVTNSYSTSGIAITLPTDTNIKVNDGVTPTTYENSGITAYADGGSGILYGGKLYLNAGEKVKLTTNDVNNKIFDADLNLVALDEQGYYTATATADLSALKSLTVKGDGWNFDAETGKLSITSNSAFTSSADWYKLRSKIKTVELASGVTEIGASAFKDFTTIETFTVGGTISTVGTDAFTGSKIKVVSLPERTKVTEGGLFTVGQNAYVLGDTLVYRYTDGYTRGTNFSVSGATSSVDEKSGLVTLTITEGVNSVSVTDSPVMLQSDQSSRIGNKIGWKVESTTGNNDYLVISGDGAIKDFETADARPEGFTSNLGTIKKVYIGPGVTHIGSNIFAGMNLSEVRIATKYYSDSTYKVAPTYSQVEIANDAFGSGQRIYRIDLPVNAYPKMNDSAYSVISNYQENGKNTWYISSTRTSNFSVQILTPEGYNLVDNNNATIGRTLSINSGTSTYSISGTSNKIWTEGDGSSEKPYIIKTTAQLQLIADTTSNDNNNFNGKCFKLDADISWGGSIPNFKGTFDGNGHTVKATGSLFGNNDGTIKNLTISSDSTNANFVNINSSGGTSGTVENCVNNSAISGTGNVGGIVNDNYGNVKNCTNNGNITCTGTGNTNYESAGGIVGVQRSGNGSLTYCTNNGAVSGTSYVGGIIGNMQGGDYVQHNFNGGAVTGTSYVGGVVGNKSGGSLYQNYYGGSCTVGGVNGTDADDAKKGYKLVFTTAGNYADKTKIESMLVGSGETLTPTLTKGYKATTLSSNDATFTQDTNGDYKFTTTSTKSEITVTATVDLDAVNLTSVNPTTEITQYDTKTIRVNGEDRLKFVSGRDYSNATPIELQDGNLKITGYGIEIPADKNSSVSNLNVINSRADINGTDEVDNVTVSNFTLQGSILYDSGSHAAYLQSSYSNISLNGDSDTVTVQDTSIVGGNLQIDGGADADNIKVQRVTVSSATIAGTDADNNPKTFARGGVLNIYGDEGNDTIEVANVKYNTTDDEDGGYKIGGDEGNDSIKVSNISVEGLSKLTVYGGAGDDTISVANISGEGIVTIDGGEGSDKIDADGKVFVSGGGYFTTDNEKIIFTADNSADNITIGGGATVEAGAKDIITVKKNSSAVIKFGEKLITVTPENIDAVFAVTADGLSIANNFDGVIEGDDLSLVTDSLGGKLDNGKTKAFITNGVISITTIELDATNNSATLEPSSTAYTVKILGGENNSALELSPISVSNQTTITANFDGANYKSLDVSGGKVNVVFDATKTKPINFKGGVEATVTDNDNDATAINWKDLFSVEDGSRVDINLDGGANTFTITDSSVKDGIGYVTGGAGNNTFSANNITVESSNSTSGIAYDAKGGNDTISVSNATLNAAGENPAVVLIQLAGGTESVSVDNVSLNGGYFQVLGKSEGNDELSFKNISAQNATFEVNESEYTANRENLSVNIDIEDVTLKGSQFGAQGYNASISVKNINVDSDSYLGLSNDYGDGNLEVDGATVTSSGRMLIYGSNDGKETFKFQNMSIESGALIFAKTSGGNDTISVANITGEGVISIDGGAGSDSISVGGGNVYVKGGEDSDTIIFSGKGSTVDATDNADVITVKQNSNAVLDFGEGNLATVTSTSADVNFSEGKLQLTKGWSGSVAGSIKLSTLPETFTLNDKTYAPKTVGDKKVLTYTNTNGTTYLYDGELDFDNLTTADLATDKWIPVAFVTVTDKTFALDSAPAETVYIVDDKNLTKYAKIEVTGDSTKTYRLANVDGNSAVRYMTIDISKFGKDISIETNRTYFYPGKNLNYVHIKTSAATFQVQRNLADEIKIGSDGKFLTAADYFVESSTGNLSAVENSTFKIKSDGVNKSITVNSQIYTTNNLLNVYATADSSYMYGGVVILKDGESIPISPISNDTLSVSGDTDGVEMEVTGINLWYIKNLADGGTVNCKGTTYKRTGNELAVKTSDAQTIYNYENDYFNVMNRGDGLQYVKVTDAINLTGDVANAIYGKDEIYSATNYLAKLEKIVYVDDNYDEHTRYELTKRDGLTDQLKVTVDDGKVLTANFDAEVTATGSVTINDKVYTAAKDSLTIVTGDKTSTLTGGTIALDSEVLVTGGKSMKFTATDDVKTLDVTISEDVIKDFNVTAGKFEIIGTENADNISVTGAQVASDNLFSISGGAGDDVINVDDISGGVATVDGGDGADVITVGNGVLVKADSADKITVTKNKSAVIQLDDKSATVTALDVDASITFDADSFVIAENWKGNISGNATLKLPKGTFTLNGTAYKLFDNSNLIYTSGDVIKLFTGELSNVTADKIATTSSNWQAAQIIDGTIDISNVNDTTAYLDANGNKIAQFSEGTLTINKDNAANINVTQTEKAFKIISADANVTVNSQFQISGASSISLTKGGVEIGGEYISTGGENSDGVTIGIADGKATSITDLKTDKEFVVVNVHSTGENTSYDRAGNEIIKCNQVSKHTTIYTVSADDNPNVLGLSGGIEYVATYDGSNQIDKIDLTDVTTEKIYGINDSYSADNYFAKLTVDGDKYTLTKRNGADDIQNLQITLPANKTLDAKFAATVNTSGNVTVNGVSYNSSGEVEISATADGSSVINGVVNVAAEQFGVKVSDDSNGVAVTFTNKNISSITGLNDGGSINYNGKTYKRVGNYIFEGAKAYACNDTTNILSPGDGVSYYEVKDSIDISKLSAGMLIVDANKNIVAEYDGNNLKVTGDIHLASITNLQDGGKVEYNGKTYTRNGNEISDGTNTYSITDGSENLLELSGAILYVQITNAIDLTAENAKAGTFYGTAEKFSSDGYFAVLAIDEKGAYQLTKRNGADDIAGLTIDAGNISTVTTNFAAQVQTSGKVTVNGVEYVSEGALTISATADSSTLYNGAIIIRDKTQEGVAAKGDVKVTKTDGALTSISGLENGESVTYNDATYTNTNNFIFSDGKAYGIDDKTNILALNTGALFTVDGVKSADGLTLKDKVVTVSSSSLGTNEVTISEGYELKLGDDVIKPTTQDPEWSLNGTTATFKATTTAGYILADNKISYATQTDGATLIIVEGVTSTDGLSFADNVLTIAGITSTVKVNDKSYSPVDTLKISVSDNKIISGTVKVTDEYGVKVTNDSDGVLVTFADEKISSISGLYDGGTLTYNEKVYKRVGTNIFVNENTVYPNVTDSSDILNLKGGTSYVTVENTTLDLRGLAESAVFTDKDKNQIATLTNGVLAIVGGDDYTVLTNNAVAIGGNTYTPAKDTLTISANKDSSYLVDGVINLSGTVNLNGGKSMKSTAELAVNVDKDTLKNISQAVNVGFTVEGSSNADTINLSNSTFATVAAVYGNAGDDSITVSDISGNGAVLSDGGAGDDTIIATNGNIFANGGEGADQITISGANAFVSRNDTITVQDSGVIVSADGKLAAAVIGDMVYEVDKNINFSDNVTIEGNLSVFGYSDALYSMQITNADVTKMGFYLSPYQPSIQLQSSSVTAYDITALTSDGNVAKTYTNIFAYDAPILTATYNNGSFDKLNVEGIAYIDGDTVTAEDLRIVDGGRFEVYGNGKISVDDVELNGTGENDGLGISGGDDADEISIGNINLSSGVFEGYGGTGNDTISIDNVNISGGDFAIFGNGNTTSVESSDDDNISAQNITMTGGTFDIEGNVGNDSITAQNIKLSGSAQFGIGGNEGDDTILVDGLNVNSNAIAYVDGGIDNDSISAANISGEGILTINGGVGDDTISVDDSANIFVQMSDGSDTVIVGGAKILDSSTANNGKNDSFPTGKSSLKKIAESADTAQEVAATVEANSADTVIIQENGKAYIIYGDKTFFTESSKGELTFKNGKAILADGWAGTLSDDTPITLTDGTFSLSGKTYSYDADEKVLYYVDSDGNRHVYTGDVENITANNFVDDGTNYELKLNEITCADGVIKLEGVKENSYFVDSNGNRLAKLEDNYLTKVADGVTQIDTSNYGKAVTIDSAFQNIPIKTVDGTFTFGGFAFSVGQTNSITIDAEGKVSDATAPFNYTLTSGGIKIESGAPISLNGEGTVNGAKFKTTTNSDIIATANSAYALTGTFIVTDSLNYSSSGVMTVENDSDGVIFTSARFNASITGLNDGGKLTYGGKTYTRKGNYIYRDGKAYACDDKTNILQLKDGVDYLEVTDSIDISKLSEGMLIVDADKNVVATYDGTTLKVTGDVELKSINGLPDGGVVEYDGKTYTRNGDKIYLDGSVYEVDDATNILELGGGVSYYEVTDSIDISKLSAGAVIVDAQKNVVADYDGTTLKVKGDVTLTSITNLQDGGTVEYNGVTYTRKGNKIYADGRVYDVDDSTNILAMGDGELYTEIVNNIIDLTKNGEMVFGINDVKVATYSGGVLTIDSGTFTVKTSGGVTIGDTVYNSDGALEISASKDSSNLINGTVNVAAEQFGVKVKNDSDGVNVKFENGAITSITGLADGGVVEYGGKTFTRKGNLIYLDGKIYEVDDSTNILSMTGGASYVEVNDTIDISGITEPVIFIKNSAQVASYSGGKLTIDSGTFTVKTSGSVTIGSTTYNSNGELEISASKNSSSVINGTVNVAAAQFGVKVSDDSDGVAVTFANKNISSISGLNDGGTVTYGGKTYKRTGDKIFKDGKVYFVDDGTNILSMGNGADYVTVTNSIDISKLSAGAVIVDANKNIVATYDGQNLNVTGDITLTSITNLKDGGTVNYKGVTYSRNGNRISDGTKTFIGDATANLLDLEKLPEVVNIDGTLNLTGIKDGSIITRNGVDIIKVKTGNGYTLTKLNNAADDVTIDAGNIGTVNLDFDATIKTLGSVTVNGTNYKTVSGVNVSVKDGKVSLLDGYISMDKTLQTADGKIYTKSSGSANVIVESGTLTSIENFVGKIKGDFTNSTGVNGSALQVLDDNDITIEAKNTNGLYEIGGLSEGMKILSDGGANRFTTDSGGTFHIGKTLTPFVLSSSCTFDRDGNIFNFKGSITSLTRSTYTINGKKVSASRAGLTFVTDGYSITEIRGLKDGDWVSGDIDGAQFTLPNGSVTFNGTTYTVKNDFDGVTVKRNTITSLDAGAELSIDKAGYYQVNGTYFTLEANQPIYGVFNPNDQRLIATENKTIVDLFNANTPIEPGDSATFIKIDEGTSIFDIKPVDIKINPNESAAVTSGQALQVEVWNGQAFTIYSPPDGSNAMVWQNGNGTTETGGTTNVSNYDASNGSGIQTNQNNSDDLLNQFINGNYSASSDISVDVGDGFDLHKTHQPKITFTFTNSAGGKTKFKLLTETSGDLAADIAKVNVENGMLANFYTFDGKANQFAWTGNNGGIIDGSNARTDLIMQGNFNGNNSGGSNLFGGKGDNAFLAGSGDNVYLGTGKNDVYLNKNREDKIGVGIYAYDNLIGDSSSGDSSDLAENIDGQSADATDEKYYSSVVNNFKFGFDYDSDILYISGNSSSRYIKQNFIEPLKEMFASLVDEINDAENDSTGESSADLAESAMIINRPISMLRQSNRQVDLISQAVIGVNTNALSAKLNELQSTLNNLRKLTPTSIKDLTNNTSSTPNLSIEEMRQQAQQINENSTSVQDNINNATPTIPDVLNILSGNGDTKANIDLPQRNTTSDQTQNNPALQQLQQEVQQLRETENGKINWSEEEKIKQEMQEIPNNSELQQYRQVAQQSSENAPIGVLQLLDGGSSTSNNTSTTDNPTQNNPEFQQLFQQAQQQAQQMQQQAQQQAQQMQEIKNNWEDEEKNKQKMQNNPELQQYRQQAQQILEVVNNAPIISLDTPLFAGDSSTSNNTSTTDNTPSTLDDLKSQLILIEQEDNTRPSTTDNTPSTLDDLKSQLILIEQEDNTTPSTTDLAIEEMRQQAQQLKENATSVQDNINNATPSTTDNTPSTLDDLKSQLILIDPKDNSGNVVQIQGDFTKNDDLKSQATLIDPKDKEIVQPYSEVDALSPESLKHMQKTFESFKRDDGGIDFKNVQLKDNSDTKSSGDAADGNDLGNVDYTKLIVGYEDGTVKTAIAGKGAVINLDWNGDERAEEYIGENSGVDVGEYEGTVAINLNTGVGVLDGDEAIIIGGVDKLKAGSGAAMFVGSADAPNTLMGGSGDSSIWGGGDTKDLLVGYSGEDKSGSTNFFYVKGDGKDTIENFAYLTSDNDYKADEINFLENSVTKIHINGKDVYLTVENDDDILKVTDAVGKDFKVRNNNTAVTAQVNTDRLTYDGLANYFYAAGKNATLTVDGSVQTAEIWLNGASGEYFTGDIKVLDAAQVEGRTTLVGNDYNNVIIAGKNNSSMWGGNSSSNDTLIGGEGSDNFFYTFGNGNDSINGATAEDTVNLFDVNLEQISNVEVSEAAVKINFTDCGSLTVNGDTSGLTYKVGGENYIVNQSTRNWTKK